MCRVKGIVVVPVAFFWDRDPGPLKYVCVDRDGRVKAGERGGSRRFVVWKGTMSSVGRVKGLLWLEERLWCLL
jgi:hypothetical protein